MLHRLQIDAIVALAMVGVLAAPVMAVCAYVWGWGR